MERKRPSIEEIIRSSGCGAIQSKIQSMDEYGISFDELSDTTIQGILELVESAKLVGGEAAPTGEPRYYFPKRRPSKT